MIVPPLTPGTRSVVPIAKPFQRFDHLIFDIFNSFHMSKIKWSNLWKGFAMGTTDLVPGVSGGTIALLLNLSKDLTI
jgi:hypothetical protein